MCQDHDETRGGAPVPARSRRKGAWRRILRSRDGAAAIEFALLAIPYFIIIFAIIETFIAYTGEQLVGNAVDTMARRIRTGIITAGNTNSTEFRRAFCDEVSIMIKCSEAEIGTPNKLWLDVRSFTDFLDVPDSVPLTPDGDLDTSAFAYSPGAQKTINMVRAYYRWDVITDLIRPLITNVQPASGDNYFLIVQTSTVRNEDYP
ncbi:TadE/TadG family type IV pilus assembly protein [Neorhizobium petrolearium]|uniref:Pilus assembly protein n=1 Tax=Neorhizobium petrolearium TaxID=515361 RepID=A0ABY8M1C8_9HYPH|nr:TadE/TadG family type IV pilus assembly protein [Neorhizobium petrolearium]MCC2613283.1 pilus assembly protein [Neorhizobium petrolearium]WGI68372.1 pilus assembly protein [Neorhizobium petrolearium]